MGGCSRSCSPQFLRAVKLAVIALDRSDPAPLARPVAEHPISGSGVGLKAKRVADSDAARLVDDLGSLC